MSIIVYNNQKSIAADLDNIRTGKNENSYLTRF